VSDIDTFSFLEREAGFVFVPMNGHKVSINNVGAREGRPEAYITAL